MSARKVAAPRLTSVLRRLKGKETDAVDIDERDACLRRRTRSGEQSFGTFSWRHVLAKRRARGRGVAGSEKEREEMKALVDSIRDDAQKIVGNDKGNDGERNIQEVANFLFENSNKKVDLVRRKLAAQLGAAGLKFSTANIDERLRETVRKCNKVRRWIGEDKKSLASFYGRDILETKTFEGPRTLRLELPRRSLSFFWTSSSKAAAAPSKRQTATQSTNRKVVGNGTRKEEKGWQWLEQVCAQHLAMIGADSPIRAMYDHEGLASTVMETVRTHASSTDVLQTKLFEILGAEGIETMMTVMGHVDALKRCGPKSARGGRGNTRSSSQNGGRRSRAGDDDNDAIEEIIAHTSGRKKKNKKTEGRNLRQILGLGRAQYYDPKPTGLPAGATRTRIPHPKRKNETLAEEIRIPAPTSRDRDKYSTKTVAIDVLPEWARQAFPGVKRLNRLQSALFEVAFKTNENMLVCAPTGSGKTNVACLTVLREISMHIDAETGVLDRESFKIIYVAPMKALAQEVVSKFGKRLASLGIKVRELTGDMQMTRKEIVETNMIVTTPEKWDVITRKSGDGSLIPKVTLLIIDEVHLLQDPDRGSVIEVLVARTLRRVESTQSLVRLVGLSATLPNYKDVALFMRVDPDKGGLFYADDAFRPVPLAMQFVGVCEKNPLRQRGVMNDLAFEKAKDAVRRGKQVLVFVHSRKDTVQTARALRNAAQKSGDPALFECSSSCASWSTHKLRADKSRDRSVAELFRSGLGCHHAGMLRSDRSLTESLFSAGAISVLVCTATLAWGVNLPAHTVIIKGTKIYNPEVGGFVELSILDVKQIQGRAGRPQFDTSGEAIMITSHDKLMYYMRLMNHQLPIESSFIKALPDHLNAEIVSGTVTNLHEAVEWLSYTYLFIRMLKNPQVYGMRRTIRRDDPLLHARREDLCVAAAKTLDRCRMVRFDKRTGILAVTALGRTASHYYIDHRTVETFKDAMRPHLSDEDVLKTVGLAAEFEQLRLRDDEIRELETLLARSCPIKVGAGGLDGCRTKANVLLQTYISNVRPRAFTLVSDVNYVSQNAGRIVRALFEIALQKGWSALAAKLLRLCRSVERRVWWTASPLRQFPRKLRHEVLVKTETMGLTIDKIADMRPREIGEIVRNVRAGSDIKSCAEALPRLQIDAKIQPITRSVLRITLTVKPLFRWIDRYHGQALSWWIWVEDYASDVIYHHEHFVLRKKSMDEGDGGAQILAFTIPVFEPLPPQYYVRCMSGSWHGADTVTAVSFKHLILPGRENPYTDLLDLRPLPVTALKKSAYIDLYRKYGVFNAVQTQVFHEVFHTDRNVLLGAPTGSGKTAIAELSCLRLFEAHPGEKAVYVAPLKSLVRERVDDWTKKFGAMGRRVVELTGDVTPDVRALNAADIVITTPEKWDGISRSWKKRGYVRKVGLVIIDEIHLLGADRGPVIEVIVSRMRYISTHRDASSSVRIVGLSTALSNAHDLAEWLGVRRSGLFNFRPSVRPVPIEVHISGFPGKHYCPRMATMNRPAYAAIRQHSPTKPVLIFVASRRQTRLTALELIALAAADAGASGPRQFVSSKPGDAALVEAAAARCQDASLRQTLSFGIGIHHAGLCVGDRRIVEEAFLERRVQILVCTATLAWGVNLPAHMVIVKGTEFFDGKLKRYVDFPITDVLQMMGRAGRPQFDKTAVACILVHQPKKNFYRKFLYEPFPVESSLQDSGLAEHVNAEIAGGTIKSREDCVDWITWTFFFRRLLQNPTYYGLEDTTPEGVASFLADVVDVCLKKLESNGCILLGTGSSENDGDDDDTDLLSRAGSKARDAIVPTTLGIIASYYYIQSATVGLFDNEVEEIRSLRDVIRLISDAPEFDELPVRHNEDKLNLELAKSLPWKVMGADADYECPHLKAFLLLQAHMKRVQLPIADYVTDLRGVMDNVPRITQALVDTSANAGCFTAARSAMTAAQHMAQARFPGDSPFLQLPGVRRGANHLRVFDGVCSTLAELATLSESALNQLARRVAGGGGAQRRFLDSVRLIPVVKTDWTVSSERGSDDADDDDVGAMRIDVTLTLTRGSANASAALLASSRRGKRKGGRSVMGWWLVLSSSGDDDDDDELLALKRVVVRSRGSKTRAGLVFEPPRSGTVRLHLVADGMYGIDQTHHVRLPSNDRVFSAVAEEKEEGFWVLPPPSDGTKEEASVVGSAEKSEDDEEGFWE